MSNDDPLRDLPHGPEFRFVDELRILEHSSRAVGRYTVPGPDDLPLLRGHFPGQPMMPGVLLGEALAQAAGALVQASSDPAHPRLVNLRLTGVQGLKILRPAYPGDVLLLRVKIQGRLGHLVQASGEIVRESDAQVIARGQVALSGDPV